MLDLCSGIGGISLAAEWAGIKTVAHCEIEPFCQKVIKKHWPDTPFFKDITDITKETLIERGVNVDAIRIVSAGYPCQPYSLAGDQLGSEDERFLWDKVFRVVREVDADWFVGENVYGHVNNGLSDVVADLEKENYEVECVVLPASAVGAPHKRERVFIIARHTRSKPSLQKNTSVSTFRSEWQAWQSLTWKHWREVSELHWSVPEPGICRVDDGVSKKLDKSRLIALGNAVVPQQIYPVFEAIARWS
ncbi:MAG: DNA (cytosine-5-)-methyltransferase [Niallia sp.]